MSELATGAVNTLLGVIRNEARRLGRVQDDVLFIQEEMESMKSFLAHLARTHQEEHDEQVRTWMNQVRILANDCNNCLDIYLYRGNPDFHRPRTGLRRHLWLGWALWWLREMVARHHAAGQLRQLRDRAREVGERRLRYGVKVSDGSGRPVAGRGLTAVTAAAQSHPAAAAAAEGDDGGEEEDDHELEEDGDRDDGSSAATVKVEDYFKKRLLRWLDSLITSESPLQLAFVLPEDNETAPVAALAEARTRSMFRQSVLVDIPKMHPDYFYHVPLRPKEILYYILQALRDDDQGQPRQEGWARKWVIYAGKKSLLREIKEDMDQKMKVVAKMDELKERVVKQLPQKKEILDDKKKLEGEIMDIGDPEEDSELHDLLCLLIIITVPVAEQEDQAWNKAAIQTISRSYDAIIQVAAKQLKNLVEHEASTDNLLDKYKYKRILEEVFPRAPTSPDTGTSTSMEAEIKQMIHKVKDMINELQEYNKSAHGNGEKAGESTQIQEIVFQEAARKAIEEIKLKIRKQLKIKMIVGKIQSDLQGKRILVILKTHHKYGWEATRKTLGLLGSSRWFAGAAIFMATSPTTTTKSTPQPEEHLHYPQLELMELSVVGCYLDIVRQDIGMHMHQDNLEIVHNILQECEGNEFCMNVFAHAMKANPKRSTQELRKLQSILQATPKPNQQPGSIARKILKFSYSDLPKQHKSCLLYLAIFQGYEIKRSTLVGRWVAEGLITTEDWSWFSSVTEADKCFDGLVSRQFVHPVDIGATGKVKSFTVYPVVHTFITKMAKKQHIVEARLSLHLARHFSIFNDVRLRSSDDIDTFLKKNMYDLPQFSKLKVLDLEGCHCFANNKGYIKDICNKILMLKYLSLKDTDADRLPHEINNLHELEVLDIRKTKIPASATRRVLLLKLKRLLAGNVTDPHPGAGSTDHTAGKATEEFCSVVIPVLVEKMIDMEVLSAVKPRTPRDLKDIGSLFQLRKLGVFINKHSHLQCLLQAISDLHGSLRSLSITLNIPTHKRIRHCSLNPLEYHPKCLENLSIRGNTTKTRLLGCLLALAKKNGKLAKVTLSGALNKEDLKALSKLHIDCLRLRHCAYTDNELTELTFDNDNEFPKFKVLIVDRSTITKISFAGEYPELQKIVWLFDKNISDPDESPPPILDIDTLRGLKELELIGDSIAPAVHEAFQNKSNEKKFGYSYKKPKNQGQAPGNNAREVNRPRGSK